MIDIAWSDNIDSILDTNPNNQPTSAGRSIKAKLKVMHQLPFVMPPVEKLVSLDLITLQKTSNYHVLYTGSGGSLMEVAVGVLPDKASKMRYSCFWLRNSFNWELITDESTGNKFLIPTLKGAL